MSRLIVGSIVWVILIMIALLLVFLCTLECPIDKAVANSGSVSYTRWGSARIWLDTASKLDQSEKIDVRYARKARALRKRT
jgi:hypothetical protein